MGSTTHVCLSSDTKVQVTWPAEQSTTFSNELISIFQVEAIPRQKTVSRELLISWTKSLFRSQPVWFLPLFASTRADANELQSAVAHNAPFPFTAILYYFFGLHADVLNSLEFG